MSQNERGFTLIELVGVLLIVGILSAIAYPSYQKHVLSTRRLEAKTALLQTAALMEHYHMTHHSYAQATLSNIGAKALSQEGHYHITIASMDTHYILTATALKDSPQKEDMTCNPLTLDDLGMKGPNPTICW